MPGPGGQRGGERDAAYRGVGAAAQIEFLERVRRAVRVCAVVEDEDVAVVLVLAAHDPSGLVIDDLGLEGSRVVAPGRAAADQTDIVALPGPTGIEHAAGRRPHGGQRLRGHRVELVGVLAVVPDAVQLAIAGIEPAGKGARLGPVGDVGDADPAEGDRSGRGQGDLLVSLATLHVLIGDRAGASDGVVVVALRIALRPTGRRRLRWRRRTARSAHIPPARWAIRSRRRRRSRERRRRQLPVVEHDRRVGAAGGHRERGAAGAAALEVRGAGDAAGRADHGGRADVRRGGRLVVGLPAGRGRPGGGGGGGGCRRGGCRGRRQEGGEQCGGYQGRDAGAATAPGTVRVKHGFTPHQGSPKGGG